MMTRGHQTSSRAQRGTWSARVRDRLRRSLAALGMKYLPLGMKYLPLGMKYLPLEMRYAVIRQTPTCL